MFSLYKITQHFISANHNVLLKHMFKWTVRSIFVFPKRSTSYSKQITCFDFSAVVIPPFIKPYMSLLEKEILKFTHFKFPIPS